jgi:hypothetical protein
VEGQAGWTEGLRVGAFGPSVHPSLLPFTPSSEGSDQVFVEIRSGKIRAGRGEVRVRKKKKSYPTFTSQVKNKNA